MKSQNGISALSMMIVIVIIILLAATAIFSSRDVVVEGNIAKIAAEIVTVKEAAQGLKNLNELDPDKYVIEDLLFSEPISDISTYNSRVGGNLRSGQEYYYLGFGDKEISDVMKESLNESLNVRSIENSYIINMADINNIEAFLVDGIRIGENTYYTYEEIQKVRSGM